MINFIIAPQCPWHDMLKSYGPPNIQWCEELICNYINNPANTWSNLSYILIAVYLLFDFVKFRKLKESTNWKRLFKLYFSISLLFTGLFSGFYHATNNHFTQFLDFIGMFTLCGSLISANYSRLKGVSFSRVTFWAIAVIFSSGFFYIDYIFPAQFLIVICIGIILLQEFLIYKKQARTHYLFFWLTLIFMAAAQVCSQLDLHRIWCDPTDHIFQGHAMWHVLGAIGLTCYYWHIKRDKNH